MTTSDRLHGAKSRSFLAEASFEKPKGSAVGLKLVDLLPGKEPGIRAQLIDTRTAELLHDFVVEPGPRSTHVLNAVSPAFTSSLPFSEYVVDMVK